MGYVISLLFYVASLAVLYLTGAATFRYVQRGGGMGKQLIVVAVTFFGSTIVAADFLVNQLSPLPVNLSWLMGGIVALSAVSFAAGLWYRWKDG